MASHIKRPLSDRRAFGHGLFFCAVLQMMALGCAAAGDASSGPPTSATGGSVGSGGSSAGTGGAGGGTVATGCPDAPARLKVGCAGGTCHIKDFEILWGDLVSDGLAARLINIDARMSMPCNGQTKLVNPSKPASGVLFERLTTSTCGSPARQMPPLEATPDQHLSESARASLVACLKSWLEPQLK